MEFDGNSERGGYYEQDNFIYNDDKSGFVGHTDGKFANSFIIRCHSITTWTKFYPMLPPSPIEWIFYLTPDLVHLVIKWPLRSEIIFVYHNKFNHMYFYSTNVFTVSFSKSQVCICRGHDTFFFFYKIQQLFQSINFVHQKSEIRNYFNYILKI